MLLRPVAFRFTEYSCDSMVMVLTSLLTTLQRTAMQILQVTHVSTCAVDDLKAMACRRSQDTELDELVRKRFQSDEVQAHAFLDEFNVNVYLSIRPVPCPTRAPQIAEVRALCHKPNCTVLFGEFLGQGAALSGHESNNAYGKFKLTDGTHAYFHLVDDEGSSGYDCCGVLALTYADSLEHLIAYGMTRQEKESVAANSLYGHNAEARKLCIPDNDEPCPVDDAIYQELGLQEQVRHNLSQGA